MEPRKCDPEKLDVVAEEASLSDASGVEGCKGDAGGIVVAAVQLAHGQHVAHLRKGHTCQHTVQSLLENAAQGQAF